MYFPNKSQWRIGNRRKWQGKETGIGASSADEGRKVRESRSHIHLEISGAMWLKVTIIVINKFFNSVNHLKFPVIVVYQSLFEWHHNHVMSLCPEVNPNLDQDLEDIPKETGTFHCLDYVYESSSEDEEIEPIDEGYLKFLEVTIKHQQELRDRRTAQTTDSLD